MHSQKICRSAQQSSLNLFRDVFCLFRSFSFLEVIQKFLKNVLKIHRDKDHIKLIKYADISWSDIGQKRSKFGQNLVRFLGNWSDRILVRFKLYLHCHQKRSRNVDFENVSSVLTMRAPTNVTICMKSQSSSKNGTHQKWLHEALHIVACCMPQLIQGVRNVPYIWC